MHRKEDEDEEDQDLDTNIKDVFTMFWYMTMRGAGKMVQPNFSCMDSLHFSCQDHVNVYI